MERALAQGAQVTPPSTPAGPLPSHFEKEWSEARQLIDKQDERIHDTRKTVFGLFASLLTASSILAGKDSTASHLWLGVHLALLGLLVAGRFIEQQSQLLQAAAASRAFVLELLTPVELTGTLSDRFQTGWAQRTTYIYLSLGLVSTVVAATAGQPTAADLATVVGLSCAYAAYVWWLGGRDLTFARDGQDWSFGATTCQVREVVSILLTNLGDRPLLLADPPAMLRRIADASGARVMEDGEPLLLHDAALGPDRCLPRRHPYRWLWRPTAPGLWVLEVRGLPGGVARRSIQVV